MFNQVQGSLTVAELTRRLRDLIESQSDMQDVWVQGEISNFSRPKSGHWYFTLKDETAELRCVMWRSAVQTQRFVPLEGEAVEAHGGINIYEARGQYQLYVDDVRPLGVGALYQQFLELKEKLEEEGLFAEELKRPIPLQPKRIGIITSPTSAALRDMLNTFARRYPLAELILAPATVQGSNAAAELLDALKRLNEFAKPDVILLSRGGGSIEDLAAFNDEAVARAIIDSEAPVISGVGHETDFSISDFVADLRAPTPTAAAELATPNRTEILSSIAEWETDLLRSTNSFLQEKTWGLQTVQQQLKRRSPRAKIQNDGQRVDEYAHRTERAMQAHLRLLQADLQGAVANMASLNPNAVLDRGYAVVANDDGTVVKKLRQVKLSESLDVRLSDGRLAVHVDKKFKSGEK